jgi:hypothetical protein
MTELFWAIALIGLAFGAHLVLWKIRLPKRQSRALMCIFFGVLAAGLGAFALMPASRALPASLPSFLHIALFHTAMTLAYVITYSALEADSPSLLIVLRVAQAGGKGVSAEELRRELNDAVLVRPRLADLVRDGLAVVRDGRFHVTPKGRALARVFVLFRGALRLGKGG